MKIQTMISSVQDISNFVDSTIFLTFLYVGLLSSTDIVSAPPVGCEAFLPLSPLFNRLTKYSESEGKGLPELNSHGFSVQ